MVAEQWVRHAEPWRIGHFGEVLGRITAHQGVWKATGVYGIDWLKKWAWTRLRWHGARTGATFRHKAVDLARHPSRRP